MEIILGGRGSGKTTKLIMLSHNTGAYIICRNQSDAELIFQNARRLNFDIPYPLTYHEFIEKQYYGRRISGFLIDDADLFLQYLTGVTVQAITLSGEAHQIESQNPYYIKEQK